ncbi:MAG: acyl-protein synthetase [Candidatus Dormibacteraeota bacterium]|nr:acyl-protein synthetase [Candidatus Dormibacteraeota bacterium]
MSRAAIAATTAGDGADALPADAARELEALLRAPVFGCDPQARQAKLLSVLKTELSWAIARHAPLRRYVEAWPIDYRDARRLADLPYLPAAAFKADPPLALVPPRCIVRTLASSATTGQSPSRVVLDAGTARRTMKGITSILRDFIGPARRPCLVIDTAESLDRGAELGARAAAIQGLRTFATDSVCCLESDARGAPLLNAAKLAAFAAAVGDGEAIACGLTSVVWQHLVLPMSEQGLALRMPNLRLLHSGGWKRLQHLAVSRQAFAAGVASVFGCPVTHVVDFYGMIEHVGVVYPDCIYGNKHVPAFADVIVRDPLTLEPLQPGRRGIVEVCNALATSFPGYALLTDDIAEVVCTDGCPCGRRGSAFRFVMRVPQAEMRGCGNVGASRGREAAGASG